MVSEEASTLLAPRSRPGGFDPFVGLFQGVGPASALINGTADTLASYPSGCPPAGTIAIGSIAGQSGDVTESFTRLAAGTYTVLLTDGSYLPNALFEAPPALLGDGFADLTGGVFQTCVDASDCNTDTANWALDINHLAKEKDNKMNNFSRLACSFGGTLLAAGVLTIAVPRAAHAVTSALVQITNTIANPAVTQDVSRLAPQAVHLSCGIVHGGLVQGTVCGQVSPRAPSPRTTGCQRVRI
jgi:hypothetical protein